MRLLGPREDRDGETTNNGLRQQLAEDVHVHDLNKDGANSAEWRAGLAHAATSTRSEMARRARAN